MNIFKCKVNSRKEPIIVEDVTCVANAIGVLISEYGIRELDILSVELIDEHHESTICIPKYMKKLKPFKWSKGSRGCTPEEMYYRDIRLDEMICPKCGKMSLWMPQYGEFGFNEYYRVECDDCYYTFPIQSSDCGECLCEAKTQLGLYDFLGRPEWLIDYDLQLLVQRNKECRDKYYNTMCEDTNGFGYVDTELHKTLLKIIDESEG